jgi:Ca-activated chloride channel family protein
MGLRLGVGSVSSVVLLGLLAGCSSARKMSEAAAPPSGRAVAAYPTEAAPGAPPAQMAADAVAAEPQVKTEHYKDYGVNPAVDPAKDRLSTFAIDVDTASYSISRRKLLDGALPPMEAVRAEEYLNYFDYGYRYVPSARPYSLHLAGAPSPYTPGHHILRVALQAKRLETADRKPVHLVYLVDTSGSMQSEDKMGLAKKSLKILTSSLKQGDTIALCTYAGSVREVLPPTGIEQKDRVLRAIDDLAAGGSTAMSSGIELAYRLAERGRVAGHINHVVVLSDGDANVGPSSHEAILTQIARYKDQGITLSTVGFGQGNYKDTMMEQLADKGDGNYAYIDSEQQARRVFSEQVNGLLEVVARDMKVQVDFAPDVVKEYRLVGYENRDVADKDFRNDKVDGGEVGAGHSVTALYDVVLKRTDRSPITVRVRHKAPERTGADAATEYSESLSPKDIAHSFDEAPRDMRFAVAVAGFAEVLRKSPYATEWRLSDAQRIARSAMSGKPEEAEFIGLVERAERLSPDGSKNATAIAR